MRVFLFLLLINSVCGLDFIIETLLKTVNKSSDPCDNFYRHACPLGTVNPLFNSIYDNTVNSPGTWDKIELINDFETPKNNFSSSVPKLFVEQCQNGKNTSYLLSQLEKITEINVLVLQEDPNCARVGEKLQEILLKWHNDATVQKNLKNFNASLTLNLEIVQAISLHLDNGLESAIEEIRERVVSFKKIAEELIMETPWVTNNDVAEFNKKILQVTVLKDDYAKIIRDSFDFLMKFELIYRQCKQNFDYQVDSHLFCFSAVNLHFDKNHKDNIPFFENTPNAFNSFPQLAFGFPFYFMHKAAEIEAVKLGAVGFVVGHELAHTLIKGEADQTQTYFSQEAIDCVQNQYNSTCTEFEEMSCDVNKNQTEENGSDVLGLDLAYKMLEKHYGDKLQEVYEPMNVTYQQLFFYSTVPFFCDGDPASIYWVKRGDVLIKDTHSVNNIRINAFVNHPAFKEAFQCSEDSRMVKSATEHCTIYGKDAPQSRR